LKFAKAYHKITLRRKVGVALRWGAPQNLRGEASDFKFATQLGFAKVHNKITPIGKSGCGLGLEELSKRLGFPYNILTTAEASNFKIGTLLGFAKAHHKISH